MFYLLDILIEVADAVGTDPKLADLLSDRSRSVEAKNKALSAKLSSDMPAEISNLLSLLIQEGDVDLLPDIGRTAFGVSGRANETTNSRLDDHAWWEGIFQ